MTEQEYRNDDAISISELKLIMNYPQILDDLKNPLIENPEQVITPALRMGTIIDQLILTPDVFEKNYFVQPDDLVTPSHKQHKGFCNFVANAAFETDVLEEAYKANFATSKMSSAKLEENSAELYAKYGAYINWRVECGDREPITAEEGALLQQILSGVNANDIARKSIYDVGAYEHHFIQMKLFSTFAGIDIKGMLDILNLDMKNKIAYVTDLKSTIKPMSGLKSAVRTYGYDKQLRFYAILAWAYMWANGLVDLEEYSEWTFVNRIIFVRKKAPFETYVVDIGENIQHEAYIAIEEMIDRYLWHKETDQWQYPREVYLANGVLKLESWDTDLSLATTGSTLSEESLNETTLENYDHELDEIVSST